MRRFQTPSFTPKKPDFYPNTTTNTSLKFFVNNSQYLKFLYNFHLVHLKRHPYIQQNFPHQFSIAKFWTTYRPGTCLILKSSLNFIFGNHFRILRKSSKLLKHIPDGSNNSELPLIQDVHALLFVRLFSYISFSIHTHTFDWTPRY